MSDPNIPLIFAQAIASMLGCRVHEFLEGYHIQYGHGIFLTLNGAIISILDINPSDLSDHIYEFHLADPDVSPKTVVAKMMELEEAKNE